MKKHLLQHPWLSGLVGLCLAGTLLASWSFAQDNREPARPAAEKRHFHKMHGDDHGSRHHRFGRHHRGPGEHLARMQEALGLTEEQAGKMRELMLVARKNAIVLHAELRVAKLNLRDTMTRPEVDQAAVNQYVQQIGDTRQKLLRQRVDALVQAHALLTPEQRAKARALLLDGPGHPRHPQAFFDEDAGKERP